MNYYEEYSSEFTASESGVYYFGFGNVTPIISESASLRLDNVRFTAGNLSVEDAATASIHVFPNPVKDIMYINSIDPIQEIKIYTINGKLITTAADVNEVDFTLYPSGIYLIKLFTANGVVVKKIVK